MTSLSNTRRWAVAQMTSCSDVERNVEAASALVDRAGDMGCELISLPEGATFMGREAQKQAVAEPLDGPATSALAEAARRTGIYVLVGSVVEQSDDPKRPYNTSVLFSPKGEVVAHYRKIHLFDVDVAGDRSYRESDYASPGEPIPVTGTVAGVKVGLTMCFDLRFPWLYSALGNTGATAIFVPSAFTVPTGRDHWEVLLRARAIETQSFVLAPAQYGKHDTGRETYGRSMVIDPWGTILAQVPDGGELAVADINFERVAALRQTMPMRSSGPF